MILRTGLTTNSWRPGWMSPSVHPPLRLKLRLVRPQSINQQIEQSPQLLLVRREPYSKNNRRKVYGEIIRLDIGSNRPICRACVQEAS